MNELIKINYDSDSPTVLGRDLHEFLEVETPYTQWFQRMCEYGFNENVDFMGLSQKSEKPQGGRPAQDHQMTIDMAKELCMIQRTERGKQARQYFLSIERKWNSPETVMARALQMADQRMLQLQSKIEQDRPKTIFADSVAASTTTILIGDLAKILRQNGIQIGQNRLFQKLRQEGYLIRKKGTSYNMPTQKAVEMGLFEIKETSINHSDGHITISKTPKVTGKGQIYFVNYFMRKPHRQQMVQ